MIRIDGIRVTYHVPFTGELELLKCRPNAFTLNPPRARIINHELVFDYDITNGDVSSTKASVENDLRNFRPWLESSKDQVEEYNQDLAVKVRQEITRRKQLLNESRQQINNLGFKVRQKEPETTKTEKKASKSLPARPRSRKVHKEVREYDIALSFAGENRPYVDKVANLLRESGVRVFYDAFEEATLWGRNLADYFAQVYAQRSRFIVMFVSQHYAAKAWPNHERKHAQARAIREQKDIILPARFDDTEIPGLPDTVGYLDLRKISPEKLAERIIEKLGA